MIRVFLAASILLTSFCLSDRASAQEPGVVVLPTQHVEGRRQRPIVVVLPPPGRVVHHDHSTNPSFVRRVTRAVRRGPF